MSVGELINALINIDGPAPGLHPTAWVRSFIAEDHEPEFAGGIIGSDVPTVFPQMRELVRRGVTSLPFLIEHLNDKRPTKLTVGPEPFTFAFFGDEYAPKKTSWFGRGSGRLLNIKYDIPSRQYTVRVGDVCYVLIGQIVNRCLVAVAYVPTLGFVVNSPIEERSLITQIKRDWGTVDTKAHMASLIADARAGEDAALQHLRFYYPDEYRRQKNGRLKKQIRNFELTEKKRGYSKRR